MCESDRCLYENGGFLVDEDCGGRMPEQIVCDLCGKRFGSRKVHCWHKWYLCDECFEREVVDH